MKAASIPSIVEPTELPLVANQLDPAIVVWLGRRAQGLFELAYRNTLPQQCLASPVKEMDKTVLVVTAGGGAGKTFLRRSIGFIEADVVLAEHALTLREQLNADFEMGLVHWVDMVVSQGIQGTLPKTKMGSEKNGCFQFGKGGVSGIISKQSSESPQLIRAGACWHIAARSACASMGAMVVLRRTCRTACRAGRMQGAWKWTRFDGWVIQGGPRHHFFQWSYGAPFFSRVKQNRYPIIFGQNRYP